MHSLNIPNGNFTSEVPDCLLILTFGILRTQEFLKCMIACFIKQTLHFASEVTDYSIILTLGILTAARIFK